MCHREVLEGGRVLVLPAENTSGEPRPPRRSQVTLVRAWAQVGTAEEK